MAEGEEPGDYISQRKDIHDCFFLVGTEKKAISTMKYFLANYSTYFRLMLLEVDMKEKNSKEDIEIPDHEPDVFELMLSYVYGQHDIKFKDVNQAMRFHILVDKCLMPKLKKISTDYLMGSGSARLCEVIECAVLLDIKEMEPRAKKTVEKDTRTFLSSPDFLNANPAVVEFVVKQEGLTVTEVELWRALVKWAKRQCENTQEGNVLRKKIDGMIKYVQFLQMSYKEFAKDVVPTSILTPTETIAIFVNMATGKGNTLREPRSKTRSELSPLTCVLSFPLEENKTIPVSSSWETCYEISDLQSTQFKIHSIQLKDFSSAITYNSRHTTNYDFHVELFRIDGNHTVPVAIHKLPLFSLCREENMQQFSVTPNIITLPDKFVMNAGRSYNICVRYSDRPSRCHKTNIAAGRMRGYTANSYTARTNSQTHRCNFCKVTMVYSSISPSGMSSSMGSLTFSVIEP